MTISPSLALSCSLALALGFPASVGAQTLTPDATAAAYAEPASLPPAPGAQLELDLLARRLARARVLRRTGGSLLGVGLLALIVVVAAGGSDGDCGSSDEFVCYDGPDNTGGLGALIAAPLWITGTALLLRGHGVAHRARRRVSVQARGAGLRLMF